MTSPGDDGVPNVARIYDHLLGGSHNFAVDRAHAARIVAARPNVVAAAQANRHFLRHAVEHALDLGVRQFLDLGCGVPGVGNVHDLALARDPGARVAYVDDEPVAVAHARAILDGVDGASITRADLRDPAAVLGAPGVARLLDLRRPVALLALAVLHFVPDVQDPASILARYRASMAPGSLLAVSHTSDDYPDDPEFAASSTASARLYDASSNPAFLRSRAGIERLVRDAGFVPDGRGTVELAHWAVPGVDGPLGAYTLVSEPLASEG